MKDYIVFLGRICPGKQPDPAIRIVAAAGIKLKLVAKIDAVDAEYPETQIKPMLEPDAELIGEIDNRVKPEFLSGA